MDDNNNSTNVKIEQERWRDKYLMYYILQMQ